MRVGYKRHIIILILTICIIGISHAQVLIKFKNNDKICFIGNSITHGGQYHAFLQVFYATRFPDVKVEYYNCGISGDVADGMISRLDKDILSHQPDYAFLMTGMNDVSRHLYATREPDAETLAKRQKALDNYYLKTEKLAQLLIDIGVKPIFLTPSIYDETAEIEEPHGYGTNEALASCAAHIRKLAIKHNAPLVDFHAVMNEINLQVQETDPTRTIIGADRIHPGSTGHFIMAYEIINTIMPSQYVSNMVLNAHKKKVVTSENCTIQIEFNTEDFTFKVLEDALPFPVADNLKEPLALVPFLDNLNNEILRVKSLPRGNYFLLIDDEEVGTYTSQELKSGINIAANRETPQNMQAQLVSDLCFKYHNVQNQLRSIAYIEYKMLNNYTGPDTYQGKREYLDVELEKQKSKSWYKWNVLSVNRYFENVPREKEFLTELNAIRDEIYKSNRPEWHDYKLVRVQH